MDKQNPLKNNNIVLKSVISVDLGTKRVGLALKPAGLTVCIPLSALDLKSAESGLLSLIEEKNADILIIGVANSTSGGETEMSIKARTFGRRIERRIAGNREIKVVFQDEAFSSLEAESMVFESNLLRGKRNSAKKTLAQRKLGTIDSLAAVEILKAYLLDYNIY